MIFHGGAVHTRFLTQELKKRDVDVEVFSYSRSREHGIRVCTAPSVSIPSVFYTICLDKRQFFNLVKESSPDVVHMHHCAGNLELSIRKLKNSGTPVVGTVHISPNGGKLIDRAIGLYFKRFLSKHLRASDKVICVSRYVENSLNILGIQNTVTIPNGIDPGVFHRIPNARKSLGLSDSDFILLYVGRLSPEKGIKTLLGAFRRLELPNKKLYIIRF